MNASFIKATAIALPVLFAALPARALECPVPHVLPHAGIITETQPQIREYGATLAGNDTGNAVGVIAQDLRKKYPGVTDAEITNFLVTAYCFELKAEGYDGARARTRIKNFADRADRLVAEVN
jgi:hypothetical protein